jgi:NAD(P)H-hydrate epimerase
MQVLTTEQMREADRRTIEEIGIPGRVLMESAGRTVVRKMSLVLPDLSAHPIEVVCGKGNNGGDGLVVFRYLATQGYSVRAWVLAPFETLSGDAKGNLDAALRLGLPVQSVPDEVSLAKAFSSFSEDCVVVDAILGTGLTSAAMGLAETAIHIINQISAFKVAVDVPSGLSSDSGEIPGEAVEADLTIALAAPKLCHVLPPACFLNGQLEIVDIGIPRQILEATGSELETVESDELSMLLAPRQPDAHKGSFGHLLVVAGSVGKTGAALMAAHAALRTGAGLVTVASPYRALPMMTPALPEAMWEPLDETADGAIAMSALPRVLDLLEGKTALALGPGVGRHQETVSFVKKLVAQAPLATVVDADGINAFAGDIAAVPPDRPLALTPHPGEAARLLKCSTKVVQSDRLSAIRRLTAQARVFAALKGYRTLISEPSGRVHINLTGNAGMASGGTGDVLTGIVGSFLAQGFDVPDALRLGVYLHGLSGDLAAEKVSEISLVATDLIRKLPDAIQCLTSAQ